MDNVNRMFICTGIFFFFPHRGTEYCSSDRDSGLFAAVMSALPLHSAGLSRYSGD
jgi:hypothetical protein